MVGDRTVDVILGAVPEQVVLRALPAGNVLRPRPGHRRRRKQADSAQARCTLHFHGVTAEDVAAIVSRVGHEDS